jgi:hypothetical protein
MRLRLRLIDPRRTFVTCLLRRHGEIRSRVTWLAIHSSQKGGKDWGALFSRALDLLMEDVQMEEPAVHSTVSFAQGAGRITWRRYRFWTIIRFELGVYSRNKRHLIAAAVGKAVRQGL